MAGRAEVRPAPERRGRQPGPAHAAAQALGDLADWTLSAQGIRDGDPQLADHTRWAVLPPASAASPTASDGCLIRPHRPRPGRAVRGSRTARTNSTRLEDHMDDTQQQSETTTDEDGRTHVPLDEV